MLQIISVGDVRVETRDNDHQLVVFSFLKKKKIKADHDVTKQEDLELRIERSQIYAL